MDEYKFKMSVKPWLYLSTKFRYLEPANEFTKDYIKSLKQIFFSYYKKNVLSRSDQLIMTQKEKDILNTIFEWSICSTNFKGDLQKGLYLAGGQGYGKDILLKTISDFYGYFDYIFTDYTYPGFCTKWFENENYKFREPIRINDITGNGKMKREKESIPFLELLDYREQSNMRRGLLVSSNLSPKLLQDELEIDRREKRLVERIKECFNVIIITNSESKRVENKIII